jgi:hypothetical protein
MIQRCSSVQRTTTVVNVDRADIVGMTRQFQLTTRFTKEIQTMEKQLFAFDVTLDSGKLQTLFFFVVNRDSAWANVWDKAREQGYNLSAIKAIETSRFSD